MPSKVIELLALRALAIGNDVNSVCAGLSADVVSAVQSKISELKVIKVRL